MILGDASIYKLSKQSCVKFELSLNKDINRKHLYLICLIYIKIIVL
jgi:hypothetical protein